MFIKLQQLFNFNFIKFIKPPLLSVQLFLDELHFLLMVIIEFIIIIIVIIIIQLINVKQFQLEEEYIT